MRLEKYISDSVICSRKEASFLIKKAKVMVNGKTSLKPSLNVVPGKDKIFLDGKPIIYKEFIYIMMNKPGGVISATDDKSQKTVLSLLPENYQNKNLFPAGRLDKDTVGLLIITNDGKTAHSLLSPKNKVEKEYAVACDKEFTDEDVKVCLSGIRLSNGQSFMPAKLIIDESDRKKARIIITEGKFHEIKNMCAYLSKKVVFLERKRFGNILLDPSLERGHWRHLTDKEVHSLCEI